MKCLFTYLSSISQINKLMLNSNGGVGASFPAPLGQVCSNERVGADSKPERIRGIGKVAPPKSAEWTGTLRAVLTGRGV